MKLDTLHTFANRTSLPTTKIRKRMQFILIILKKNVQNYFIIKSFISLPHLIYLVWKLKKELL